MFFSGFLRKKLESGEFGDQKSGMRY